MSAEQEEDFNNIREFLDGNRYAFEKIINKYQKQIYWYARKMLGTHDDADEVTQQVIIVIYEKLNTFKFNSALFTWIYRITSTRCLNFLKRKKIKSFFNIDEHSEQIKSKINSIQSELENKEKVEKINTILLTLPPKQREIFIFRIFNELSYEEISQITGKSVGALKANYHHALAKVMENYNEEE